MKAFSVAILLVLATACSSNTERLIKINGEAQGTTWHITYLTSQGTNYKSAIDSILIALDNSLSTYRPASTISRINNNDSEVTVDHYFVEVFNKAIEVSEKTGGLFDVTVGPLVNAWGFGFTKKANIDSAMIDSLLDLVDYKMLSLQGNKLIKTKPQIILDFNAIAQGYSVDILADFFESKKMNNYLIELGGEVKAKGKKNGESWKVGIDQPDETNTTERRLEAIIELNNKALATSGNYRKFYEEDGEKYAHILDPGSGYPAKQNILSATVLANDAITADAYATAFMVMGLDRSKQFLADNKDLKLEVYFIYTEKDRLMVYSSESLKKLITKVH